MTPRPTCGSMAAEPSERTPMTEPQETLSAMERQGQLLQDLARVLLT